MVVISHRGFWKTEYEKNTKEAFEDSIKQGFGVETDVRDCKGELVISHDMPLGGEMSLHQFASIFSDSNLLVALNIKSDGVSELLQKEMQIHSGIKWFVFDMSIPDMKSHLDCGNPTFTRMSDVESCPIWLDSSQGVWLDSFKEEWYDLALIRGLLKKEKQVCIVSSELHGRNYADLWKMLLPLREEKGLILCTDYPIKAREYFNN